MAKQTTTTKKAVAKVELTLAQKLTLIQSELNAPKNQRNNFGKYNYRSCEDILEAVKPHLKKHNCFITITDGISEVAEIPFINAQAEISDGINSIRTSAQAGINPNRKGMDIAQSFGASSSYARKYALNGLLLIDDNKDADTGIKQHTSAPKANLKETLVSITNTSNKAELTKIWTSNSSLHSDAKFVDAITEKGKSFA